MDQPPPMAYQPIEHPPVMPGAVLSMQRRTVWPTVLGVIAIVFGILGFLQGLMSLAAPLLMPLLPKMTAQNGFDPMAGMDQWRAWLLGLAILTSLAGAALLTGGILTLQRHHASRGIVLAWSFGKMALAVVSSYVGYELQQAQFASMQQAGMGPAGMQQIMVTAGVVGVAIGVIWAWALPVFMIIWFWRKPIRQEVASWHGRLAQQQVQGSGMTMPGPCR